MLVVLTRCFYVPFARLVGMVNRVPPYFKMSFVDGVLRADGGQIQMKLRQHRCSNMVYKKAFIMECNSFSATYKLGFWWALLCHLRKVMQILPTPDHMFCRRKIFFSSPVHFRPRYYIFAKAT